MNWQECDDDGRWPDDEPICWEEIEEFAGPEYHMWRDKMDEESPVPTWRPPSHQTFVVRDNWEANPC